MAAHFKEKKNCWGQNLAFFKSSQVRLGTDIYGKVNGVIQTASLSSIQHMELKKKINKIFSFLLPPSVRSYNLSFWGWFPTPSPGTLNHHYPTTLSTEDTSVTFSISNPAHGTHQPCLPKKAQAEQPHNMQMCYLWKQRSLRAAGVCRRVEERIKVRLERCFPLPPPQVHSKCSLRTS